MVHPASARRSGIRNYRVKDFGLLAYKPLYDFFRRVLILAGSKLCGLPGEQSQDSLGEDHLGPCQAIHAVVDGSYSEWDELISNVQNVRESVEHDLDYDLPLRNLEGMRKAAPEFRQWILETGMRVLKESSGFTLKEHYLRLLDYCVNTARQFLELYGGKTVTCMQRFPRTRTC